MLRLPSIRAKLLAIFLVAAVVPIALVSLISYRNSIRAVEEMVGNRTNRLALSVEEELSRKLTRRINDRLITENRPVQDFLVRIEEEHPRERRRASLELQEYIVGLYEEYGTYYDELLLADEAGKPVFRYDRTEGSGAAVRFLPAPTEERIRTGLSYLDSLDVSVQVGGMELAELQRLGIDMATKVLGAINDSIAAVQAEAEQAEATDDEQWIPPGLEIMVREAIGAPGSTGDKRNGNAPTATRAPSAPAAPPFVRPLRLQDLTDEDFVASKFGKSLKPGEYVLLSDRSGPSSSRAVRLVRPIYSVDHPDRRLGTLIATLRMDFLFPDDLASRRFGQEGELAVVDVRSGEILFHTNPGFVGKPINRADPRLLDALMAEMDGPHGEITAPYTKVRGEKGERLASALEVAGVPWGVIATALPREFTKETRRAGLYNLLVASLAILLAGTVLLVSSERISHSIRVLNRGATEIAAGNLNHSISVQTHDEIQTLGETFNMMTASLRENIALREKSAEELARLNRTLEDRVEDRTKELQSVNAALNEANTELKELDRLKTNFLHTVSHEFRTPLTSITAFSEILLDETTEIEAPVEVTRFLKIIHTESERLGRLIRNLLDLARIESGRIIWAKESFKSRDVIQSALDGLLPVFVEKDIVVTSEIRCGDSYLEADRDRIQQVITNLLENAVKFSAKGATLGLDCIEVPLGDNGSRGVRISVRDQGPGIPPDSLDRIFERFHQVDNSETRAAGGTGLGLAISKEIVEHHGGRIWAESVVGEGTSFHFTLPLARDAATQPSSEAHPTTKDSKHA